jgi:hypothetical protein
MSSGSAVMKSGAALPSLTSELPVWLDDNDCEDCRATTELLKVLGSSRLKAAADSTVWSTVT